MLLPVWCEWFETTAEPDRLTRVVRHEHEAQILDNHVSVVVGFDKPAELHF